MNLGKDDAIITVATDGADLYLSELNKSKEDFEGIFDETSCAEIFGQYMKAISLDNMIELNQREKERIFNLGYYTWVEQQGVDIKDFEKRKKHKGDKKGEKGNVPDCFGHISFFSEEF